MSPIIARDTKREFRPAPEGLHNAVCVDVVDHGMQATPWGRSHKVEARWQIEEINSDNGKRFLVCQRYTLSLHEKARLRHHLEGWRGKKFTSREVEEGVVLDNLVGVACQLQIVHNTVRDGETYANVQAILPLSKGMSRLKPVDYVRVQDRDEASNATNEDRQATEADDENDEEFPF
jgi:hypothetical protein